MMEVGYFISSESDSETETEPEPELKIGIKEVISRNERQ